MNTTIKSQAIVYTTRYCGYCVRAKSLLTSKGVAFTEIAVDGDSQARADLVKRTGQHTVPQIWVGEDYVGGCDDLMILEMKGELDRLLDQ